MREDRWADAADAFANAFKQAPDQYNYALLYSLCMRRLSRDREIRGFLAEVLKVVPRDKVDWHLLRLFHDMGGDTDIAIRIEKEKASDVKGRMLYYLAQYYDLRGNSTLATKYHLQVRDMGVQNIVEWRLNEWALSGLERL